MGIKFPSDVYLNPNEISTASNIPNTIVQRDNNGNFSAGTITATLSGSASNANLLKSMSVTSSVVSNTVVQRDANGNFSAGTITASLNGTASNASQLTDLVPATAATANTIVERDSSGNITANTFNGTLNGNASTASQLATARTIQITGAVTGLATFNGSSNITISTVPSTLSSQILHLDDAQYSTTATTGAPTTVKTFRFAQDSTHPVTTLDVYASAWLSYANPTIIPVGTNPQAIAVNPNTGKVYVANAGSGTVSVISGSSVTATITVGSNPQDIAVNPSTNYIYVANNGSNTVSVISGGSNTVVSTITVQTGPTGIAVNPNTNTIYAVNNTSGSVSTINGANNTVTATITGMTDPMKAVVNTLTNYVYISSPQAYPNGTVYIISGSANTLIGTANFHNVPPFKLAFNPNTNTVAMTWYGGAWGEGFFTPSGSALNYDEGYPLNDHFAIDTAYNTKNNNLFTTIYSPTQLVINLSQYIPLPNIGGNYAGVAVNSNTNQVYITLSSLNEVAVLDMNTYLQLNANVDGTNTLTLTQSAVTEEQIFALKGLSVPSTDGIHTLNLQLSTSNASYSAYTQLLEVYQND